MRYSILKDYMHTILENTTHVLVEHILHRVFDRTSRIGTFMEAREEATGSILKHFILYSTK